MREARRRFSVAAIAVASVAVLAAPVAVGRERELDVAKLKAKPAGIPTKIAAVGGKRGRLYVTLSTKKHGKYEERARDTATGARVGDGEVAIEATQAGESSEKNGGEGLLSVGSDYNQYFHWNAKRGKISFYHTGETPN